MPFSFPSSPTVGQTSVQNGRTYTWSGAAWELLGNITNAVLTTDSRLSDARTPTAHKTSHATGGSDALTASDIGAAASSHNHAATDITSGTLNDSRLSANVVLTSDSRLSDARTPTAHTHGNISNTGAIGSTANLPLITTTDGAITTGAFGTAANSFCQGNDSRLSDARTPTAHKTSHATGGSDALTASDIGAAATSHTHAATDITSGTLSDSRLSANVVLTSDSRLSDARTPTAHKTTHATGGSDALTASDIGAAAASHTHAATDITSGTLSDSRLSANVVLTSDSRLSDARTPTAHKTSHATGGSDALTASDIGAATSTHVHGNITNAGAVGSTANLPLITTTSGVITTGTFGTAANSFCQGNDSRLSDARTPTAHKTTHATGGSDALTASDIGAAASSHTHGNITNAGAIGSTANQIAVTTTSGVLTTAAIGSGLSLSGGTLSASGGSAELVYSYATEASFPGTGDATLLYFATDTGRMYRWTGSVYVEVGSIGGSLVWKTAPATSTSTGSAGDLAYDSNYIYVCTAANTWRAASLIKFDGDPYWSSVSLLLRFDGTGATFTDSSQTPKTLTVYGNSTQSATQSKFGGKSLYLDGSGDYLKIAADAAFGFGTNDFTIECWYYPLQNVGNEAILDLRTADAVQWLWFGKSSGGALRTYDASSVLTGGSVTLNAWNHVAWSRVSGTNNVYLNGTRVITWSNSGDVGSTRPVTIGGNTDGVNEQSYAYIDELRITKGIGRYNGATITTPTVQFPAFST